MSVKNPSSKREILIDLPPFIYGTTRLGDDNIPFSTRVEIASEAMKSFDWFHTSHTYNNALDVLRKSFDSDRTQVPKLIVKIGWNEISELRDVIYQNINPLGVDKINIGQLCLGGNLAADYSNGGKCFEEFQKLKDEGLVERFVVEVFPWTSAPPLKALRAGFSEGIIDGYIFYLNPLQRFASNELWNLLNEKEEPIIAMRTVSGGPVHKLRDIPGFAWKEYLQNRAVEIAPIFEESGIKSWTEFCVRFAHSFKLVRATVGSTANFENLIDFAEAVKNITPLPKEIIDKIERLHTQWSDTFDIKAEPWSM
jgi:hypothetical protein